MEQCTRCGRPLLESLGEVRRIHQEQGRVDVTLFFCEDCYTYVRENE